MALQFVSIYEDKPGSFVISIPARYSVHGVRKFIHTDRNGIGYDSYNFALRDAIKVDDDIAHKGRVDPSLYTSRREKKFIMRHFTETWLKSKTDIAPASARQYRYALVIIGEG